MNKQMNEEKHRSQLPHLFLSIAALATAAVLVAYAIFGLVHWMDSKTELATIKKAEYVRKEPFENCKGCSIGVFKKGENTLKLAVSDENLLFFSKGTNYDLTYEVRSTDYPNHEVVKFNVSQ